MALTSNQNFLQPTGFKLIIDRINYPNLEFFCQTIQHGSVSVAQTDVAYSRIPLKEPGDTIAYSDVTFDVILDENLEVYKELHNWLINTVERKSDVTSPLITNITLMILNSHMNTSSTIQYFRAYPIDIGTINLTSSTGSVQYLTMPVTFVFDYFEMT